MEWLLVFMSHGNSSSLTFERFPTKEECLFVKHNTEKTFNHGYIEVSGICIQVTKQVKK